MARVPLLAGNWKMNQTNPEAAELARRLVDSVGDVTDREVLVAPPFTALTVVAEVLSGSRILLGAQNIHPETSGAFTGEVSADMVRSAGCGHVIVGHSERRQLFGEDDDLINQKVHRALRAGLSVILCVGETLAERKAGRLFDVVGDQFRRGTRDLTPETLSRMILAYEPVWAIGTGQTASAEQAQEMHVFLRDLCQAGFGAGPAQGLRILYGGSVKPANIDELMACPDIDGALVGGASLTADEFTRIVRFES